MDDRKQTVVVRGETPPFADLVDFPPLEVQPECKTSGWWERWGRLAPRTQAAIVGCGLVVVGGGAVAMQPQSSKEIVRVGTEIPGVPPGAPQRPVERVAERLPQYVVAIKTIPLNARITAEDLEQHFRSIEAKDAPAGTVMAANSLVGRYAQRAVNAGQFVAASDFGRDAVSPAAVSYDQTPDRIHVLTVSGPKGNRAHRYEMRDEKWKIVESE